MPDYIRQVDGKKYCQCDVDLQLATRGRRVQEDEEIAREAAVYRAEESSLKAAIYEKSHLYFGVGFFAIVSYVAAEFGPAWVRWVAGFFIAGLLVGQFGMLSLLRRLRHFYAPFRNDFFGIIC